MSLEILDIGRSPYQTALDLQLEVRQAVEDKRRSDCLILVEHPPVYTFGKSADKNNLLINEEFLASIGAEVYETDRGGDITYHGPGQLVGYPIIDLKASDLGVRRYVELLEQALIEALGDLGIKAYQIPGLVGIWVGETDEIKRKIGAIGIRVRNGISMHGFALNINTDLNYFNHIVPCGITDKGVTSIQAELGRDAWDDYKQVFIDKFTRLIRS